MSANVGQTDLQEYTTKGMSPGRHPYDVSRMAVNTGVKFSEKRSEDVF